MNKLLKRVTQVAMITSGIALLCACGVNTDQAMWSSDGYSNYHVTAVVQSYATRPRYHHRRWHHHYCHHWCHHCHHGHWYRA